MEFINEPSSDDRPGRYTAVGVPVVRKPRAPREERRRMRLARLIAKDEATSPRQLHDTGEDIGDDGAHNMAVALIAKTLARIDESRAMEVLTHKDDKDIGYLAAVALRATKTDAPAINNNLNMVIDDDKARELLAAILGQGDARAGLVPKQADDKPVIDV